MVEREPGINMRPPPWVDFHATPAGFPSEDATIHASNCLLPPHATAGERPATAGVSFPERPRLINGMARTRTNYPHWTVRPPCHQCGRPPKRLELTYWNN